MYAGAPGRPVSSTTRLATATNENQSPASETTLAITSRRKSRFCTSTARSEATGARYLNVIRLAMPALRYGAGTASGAGFPDDVVVQRGEATCVRELDARMTTRSCETRYPSDTRAISVSEN